MVLWAAFGILTLATIQDLRSREVSDLFPLAMLVLAAVAVACGWHDVTGMGLLGGAALGFGLSAPFFFLGEGLGGADVKLLTALGALVGLGRILPLLFWIAMAGGALCLIAVLRGKRDIAYVPALLLGLLCFAIRHEIGS